MPALIADEALLRDAFQVRSFDEDHQHSVSLFKPKYLHPQNKRAVLAVIEAGLPMVSLLDDYVALAGKTNSMIKARAAFQSRNAEHIRCFSGVVQCLLGLPEYKDVVMAYLRNDLAGWRLMSFGFLGGSGMHGVVGGDPAKHRASCVFSSLLDGSPDDPISNLCRDQNGLVLSPEIFDQILLLESDAHGFLMSAIANLDREAVEGLLCSGVYLRFISREHTLMRVGDNIKGHPEWNLEESLGPLLAVKNHETAMTELKRMIDEKGAKVPQFLEMFWPEISPMAISHLVAYAIKSMRDVDSAKNFLMSCVQGGFDLSLGILEARSGFGAALDALGRNNAQAENQMSSVESYLWFIAGGAKMIQLAPILTSVPAEILASHAKAHDLLLDRYELTGEKELLALGGRKFRGKALEIDMGL